MSVKLVAVYHTPGDPAAFEEHYRGVHAPLVRRVPGLVNLRITRITTRLMGEGDIHMIAEMVFADRAAFDAAMASPENRVAGKDLANFADGKVTLFVAED
ncbi:uncharacterized protein (TIGR02118 family) [Novosphingobium sp. 1529]|uniref:EthD family reductase n=1 Tax=Novosphingobium sp. 1529 TaxID=3156424 RepID=UPI00145BCBE0